MSDAPLDLALRLAAHDVVVGESVVLRLDVTARADRTMVSPELNRDRTAVDVTDLASGASWTFTGADHVRLHRVPGLEVVGETFDVTAGQRWTAELDLFQYTVAPRAGHYGLRVRYRWGDADDEQVATNAVELRVRPASLRALGTRWFAMAASRDVLGVLRAVDDGGVPRWFLHTATRHDPNVALHAADVGAPDGARSTPALAQLDDIAAMHFERVIAWARDDGFGWMTAQIRGRVRGPMAVSLPGASGVRLVDPPLQPRAEGVAAVLLSTAAVAVRVQPDGRAAMHEAPVDASRVTHAVATWGGDEQPTLWSVEGGAVWRTRFDPAQRSLVGDLGDAVVHGLFADTPRGAGSVFALVSRGTVVDTVAWRTDEDTPAASTVASWDLADLGLSPSQLRAVATRYGARGLALLLRADDAWVVRAGHGVGRVAVEHVPAEREPSLVVNARDKVFLLAHHAEAGLFAVHVPLAEAPR